MPRILIIRKISAIRVRYFLTRIVRRTRILIIRKISVVRVGFFARPPQSGRAPMKRKKALQVVSDDSLCLKRYTKHLKYLNLSLFREKKFRKICKYEN